MWLNRNVKWDQTLSRGPFHLYNIPSKIYEKIHTGQLWQRINYCCSILVLEGEDDIQCHRKTTTNPPPLLRIRSVLNNVKQRKKPLLYTWEQEKRMYLSVMGRTNQGLLVNMPSCTRHCAHPSLPPDKQAVVTFCKSGHLVAIIQLLLAFQSYSWKEGTTSVKAINATSTTQDLHITKLVPTLAARQSPLFTCQGRPPGQPLNRMQPCKCVSRKELLCTCLGHLFSRFPLIF